MADAKTDVDFLMLLDDICEEYEALFLGGKAPRVEDYLSRVSDQHRATFLQELAGLEARLRASRGEHVSADELVSRFGSLLPLSDELNEALRSTVEKALASTHRDSGVTATVSLAGRPAPSEPPLPQIEGFHIDGILGIGGMGVVYKAQEGPPLKRQVALKMILNDGVDNQDYLERFVEEAKAVAELNDPHFVQIYQYGESNGRPYMALEFIEAGSLEDVRQGEPQPLEYAARTVEHLAIGMHTAHQAGLVHRDLKPHNVLLAPDGTPKITDFGLVKRLEKDSQKTAHGRVMGTASYMAPEQSRDAHAAGPAADLHALGGILYCLLTGRPPYLAATVYDTILQVRNEEPVSPSQLRPGIPKDLETICLKCLQKEPVKRYVSAAALAEDLRRYQEGRPILARPVSPLERAWRWARRNPRVAGLSGAVAGLMAIVAVVSTVASFMLADKNQQLTTAWGKEAKARGDAEDARDVAQEQRNVAREQRNLSLDLIRTVTLRIDSALRDTPRMFQVREEVLKLAMQDLKKVRDHASENPLEDRTEAIAWQRLGDVYLGCNRLDDAVELYERARGILESLARMDAGDPVHVRNLAAMSNKCGDAQLRRGETLKARELYQRALDLRERWVIMLQADPDAGSVPQAESRKSVAESYGLLGRINLILGDPAAALENYQASQQRYGALPVEFRRRLDFRRELAAVEQRLGEANYLLGNVEQAQEHYQAALNDRQRLFALAKKASREADLPFLARDICLSWIVLGDFQLREHQDPSAAWEHYKRALAVFLELWNDDPESAQTRTDLAAIHYRVGATMQLAAEKQVTLEGATGTAESHFGESRKLREELAKIDPTDFQAKIEYAVALARCGEAIAAEKLASELVEQGEDDPRLLFQAACTLALCAEATDAEVANRCRDSAFQVLHALIESGWKDRVALQNDPDLAPVRPDERFGKLVDSLPSPAAETEPATRSLP